MNNQSGVYLIMVRARKILVLRRAEDEDPLFKDVLDYPGGRMHTGEHPREAALREGLEETGLKPGEVEFLRTWEHLWDDGVFHVHSFVCWEPEGEVRLSDEHSDHHWLTPEEVLAQEYPPHQMDSPIFTSWLAGFRQDTRLVESRLAGFYRG
ncbi:NUDIX domain-containing protein [[Actinomadura] parvosata]|uniref:NUDIX domain-containing protein n=1 Tax=[Actinomadura] parvosata TaxID=1955412 RepID=UPI00406D45BA